MKTEIGIVVAAVVAVIIAAALLLGDLRGRPPQAFTAPVGYLEQAWNNVQQRDSSSAIFQKVQPEGIVRSGDVVRTGPKSGVIVRIEDGTSIELAELSMVSMDVTSEGMKMRFEGKGLRLQRNGANGNLSVDTSQGQLIVGEADLRVFNDGLKILVDRGGVKTTDAQGNMQTLGPEKDRSPGADDPFLSPRPQNQSPRFPSLFSDPNQFTPYRPPRQPLEPPDMTGVEVKHGGRK